MQQDNSYNDKEKKENAIVPDVEGDTAEDGVVYVVNDDGTPFDTSDRTYVSVEGLEETTNDSEEREVQPGGGS